MRLRSILVFVLLLVAAARAGAEATAEQAPLAPGTILDPTTSDPAWRELFAAIQAQGAVFCSFTERRWFSVRREPVVLRGELRHSPERGLSLRYLEPEERMMIIDAKGILLRNAAGRSRALKTDARAPQVDALLLHVLRFDLAALHAQFEIRGARDGMRWRLDFTPRTPELARSIGTLSVGGETTMVRRLEFSRGPKQRVEVALDETHTGVTFSEAELAKYFR